MPRLLKICALLTGFIIAAGQTAAAEIELKNQATISVAVDFPVHLYPAGTMDFFQAIHIDPGYPQNATPRKYQAIGFSDKGKSYHCFFDRNIRLRETAYSIHGNRLGTPSALILQNASNENKARATCKLQ